MKATAANQEDTIDLYAGDEIAAQGLEEFDSGFDLMGGDEDMGDTIENKLQMEV